MTKTVELALPPSITDLTLSVRALDGSGETATVDLEEQSDHPGRYLAAFEDEDVPAGEYWFWVSDDFDNGRITIGDSDGPFLRSASAVIVQQFSSTALNQLSAIDVVIDAYNPTTRLIRVVRGCDHLYATGNGFVFRNPAGSWPDMTGRTLRLECSDGVNTAIGTATLAVATGSGQEVRCELNRDQSALLRAGNGAFAGVAEATDGALYPFALGSIVVIDRPL